MNNRKRQSADKPFTHLYIYYLKGAIEQDNRFFGSDFLGNWEEDGFSFLFFSSPSSDRIERLLQIHPEASLLDQYEMPYEDWLGGSLDPFRAGRYFIHPPWRTAEIEEDANADTIDIVMDPGVVFGTGRHATTRDCLEAMELAFSHGPLESALDLGTGTGLLAVAAAKTGCKSVLAVDLNYLAAKTAAKNVRLNQLDGNILVIRSSADYFLDNNTDLVVANIHYDVMKRLIFSKGFLGRKFFILSGLLRSQARDAAGILSSYHATILKKWEHDGIWHTFLGSVD